MFQRALTNKQKLESEEDDIRTQGRRVSGELEQKRM